MHKYGCIILILISFFIIFYQFPILPQHLAFDEVEFAKLALSLDGKPYMSYSTLATGHSTLYFYIILLFFKLFGITQFALRLPSALFGVLCVIVFYKTMFIITKNKTQSFISSFILITLRWYFSFARFSFEPTLLLLLELCSIFFLFHLIKTQKNISALLLGIFTGLAFNSYTPGRIFFLLIFGFLFIYVIFNKEKHILWPKIVISSISFLIIIIPLQSYLLTHQDIRFNQLFFFSNEKLSLQQKAQFVGENIINTVGMFFIKGDSNGKHNYPYKSAVNPIIGMLLIAGLIIIFSQKKKFEHLFFICYALISVAPTILTYPWENPSMLRTYTVLPTLAYISTLPFTYILQKKNVHNKKLVLSGLLTLLILSSLYEIRTYFIFQKLVFSQSFEIKKELHKVIQCPNVLECNK